MSIARLIAVLAVALALSVGLVSPPPPPAAGWMGAFPTTRPSFPSTSRAARSSMR